MKLHLGCGDRILEDYINVDLYSTSSRVLNLDLGDLKRFEANSVDEILCIHSLEHIPHPRTIATLKEWKRVLRPAGQIIFVVPDAKRCFHRWLKDPDPFGWWSKTIWGLQDREGQYHSLGFREGTAAAIAHKAGLELVSVTRGYSHGGPDLMIKLTK